MKFDGFEWDEFNFAKSFEKHSISCRETEQVFFNEPLIYPDVKHSIDEVRQLAFGMSDCGVKLLVAFTLRRRGAKVFIRPISSRPMHKRERSLYEKASQKNIRSKE